MESTQAPAAAALRPLPLADEVSAPFWAAARQGRLDIQRCTACRHWIHAPALACPACGSEELAFEPVSGRGTLYSWTVLHHSPGPGFADMLPLIVGIVELAEQPHLLLCANLLQVDASALRLGMPVRVCFEWLDSEHAVPQFVPAGDA